MDQTNPQPSVVENEPESRPERNNQRIIVIGLAITALIALSAFTLIIIRVVNPGPKGGRPNHFNKIKLGRTTSREVIRIYGEPTKITEVTGANTYLYPSSQIPFMHQVIFSQKTDKVLLVNEFVGEDSRLTLDDFSKRYGPYDQELFTVWGKDFRVYLFLKSGILIHVDVPSARVIEVGYFNPDDKEDIMKITDGYLLNEPPEHF